ncbi:hypothetical protein CY35_07G105100 [Sphagnum magellanicum]|uniref:Uncharacterized protein n=1 Tax=Sphagnum magellanicum TaxID=128215 RepID=A0ACB8HNK0_9BRYO|nr:hypothetical protein CY35_07G105100 [Sphagnum magellanicum]
MLPGLIVGCLGQLQRSEAVGLVVIDEEDNQTLLVHRISADDIYRRQEDTIISWTDPEVATDLALSFQETMGCSFIWDQICNVQRLIHFPSVGGLESSARPVSDELEHSGTSQDDDDAFHEGGGGEVIDLPPAELATLPQIAKTIGEVLPFNRERVATMVVRDQTYIHKLMEIFRICEERGNTECLRLMFKVVKGLISLNDGHIFDIIFSDEYMMDIVGALEYDSELSTHQDHRKYLREQVVFKEAVSIHDPAILSKIHQTYRIGYIKDVILPKVLDDQTFVTINSIMLFNNVAVVSSLQNDSTFLSELFSKLRSPDTSDRCQRDLVLFIQEFCNLSKHLQLPTRSQLFSTLVKEGLFDIVKTILESSDESIRLSGCDILIVVLNHDPALLRTFLVHQPQHTLFSELVWGMLTQSEGGLQAQLLEIMRMLLDSETMDTPQVEKSQFLEVFYDKYMDQMVEVLKAGCPPEPGSREVLKDLSKSVGKQFVLPSDRNTPPEILGNICELMCFCVQHHRFRIKYYVMRNNVVQTILRLTRRREKYLVVAAVRFLRTCIALKDEFYYKYIVKHNCFEPVITAFLANGNRYNLLNSAVLELIDFIRREGIKSLIAHLVEKFSTKLEGVDYVDTFQALKLKYEQGLEGPAVSSLETGGGVVSSVGPDHGSLRMRNRLNHLDSLPDSRKRKDERALDKDEENYFNEDSDDEDTATARVSSSSSPPSAPAVIINNSNMVDVPFRGSAFGLVDYEDEDEDVPTGLGTNGKEQMGMLQHKNDNSLSTIPIADPIWPDVEDVTAAAKRKTPISPSVLETDAAAAAAASKRQKPETGQAVSHSCDLGAVRGMKDLVVTVQNAPSGKVLSIPEADDRMPTSSPYLTAVPIPHVQDNTTPVSLNSKEHSVNQQSLSMVVDGVGSGGSSVVMNADYIISSNGPINSNPITASDNSQVQTSSGSLDAAGGGLEVTKRHSEEVVSTTSPSEDMEECCSGSADSACDTTTGLNGCEMNSKKAAAAAAEVACTVAADRFVTENGGAGGCSGDNCNRGPGIGGGGGGSDRVVGGGDETSKTNNNGCCSESNSDVIIQQQQQQHSVSIGSETNNKLASLGSDLMRVVSPSSPGPYSVR